MKTVTLLITQDGEYRALYIDKSLLNEGEHLVGEGASQERYWMNIAHSTKISGNDLKIAYLNDLDNRKVNRIGYFPLDIQDLDGDY